MTPRRLILLLSLERISPLAFPCYGNRTVHTPALDQLVKQGVVYHQHYVPTTDPVRNRSQWWTGQGDVTCSETNAEQQPSDEDQLQVLFQNQFIIWMPEKADSAEWDEILLSQLDQKWKDHSLPFLCWLHGNSSDDLQDREKVQRLDQWVAQLQSLCQKSPEQLEIRWIISAAGGNAVHAEQGENVPAFQSELEASLSARLWAPLIIIDSQTTTHYSRHLTELTSGDEIYRWLKHWFGAEVSAEHGEDGAADPADRALLLSDEHRLGLMTTRDLLVVPRDLLTNENLSEAPAGLKYYLKPEDRFEISNLVTTDPERVQTLWQRLQTLRSH